MIPHTFIPQPWPIRAHLCDARDISGGRPRQCGRPIEEHAALVVEVDPAMPEGRAELRTPTQTVAIENIGKVPCP